MPVRGHLPKEATVKPTAAVFQPELIELMRAVLDAAMAMLPEAKRTSAMKAEIASLILACAAKGERDPIALKNSALLAVVQCTHYSHDISPERRVDRKSVVGVERGTTTAPDANSCRDIRKLPANQIHRRAVRMGVCPQRCTGTHFLDIVLTNLAERARLSACVRIQIQRNVATCR